MGGGGWGGGRGHKFFFAKIGVLIESPLTDFE